MINYKTALILVLLFVFISIASRFSNQSSIETHIDNYSSEPSAFTSPAISTPLFDGTYKLDAKQISELLIKDNPTLANDQDALNFNIEMINEMYNNLTINHGIIHCGTKPLVQEYKIYIGETVDAKFTGQALFHEDMHDYGDAQNIFVELEKTDNSLEFSFSHNQNENKVTLYYIKK